LDDGHGLLSLRQAVEVKESFPTLLLGHAHLSQLQVGVGVARFEGNNAKKSHSSLVRHPSGEVVVT
jgi:hypothetical protein